MRRGSVTAGFGFRLPASSSTTERPASTSRRASAHPAVPAPTMSTSVMLCLPQACPSGPRLRPGWAGHGGAARCRRSYRLLFRVGNTAQFGDESSAGRALRRTARAQAEEDAGGAHRFEVVEPGRGDRDQELAEREDVQTVAERPGAGKVDIPVAALLPDQALPGVPLAAEIDVL